MAFKGDNLHPSAAKERHVVDCGQIVGIDVDLELGLKVKAVLMQKAGV
jgi:hypothetical protein